MGDTLDGILQLNPFGRATVRLPVFSGWGTAWEFSGAPDDRDDATRAGVFPVTLAVPPPAAQVRAVRWLVDSQADLADEVAVGLLDYLRLFAGGLDAEVAGRAGSLAGVRDTVLLTGVTVYDPRLDARYGRDGVALVGLAFACQWCGHTDDHGVEVVVGGGSVLHVGDQCSY